MGMHDWSVICQVENIANDGYKDILRVHCCWKCNGWRYNMSPVYGWVKKAGEGEICVANGIAINYQNNSGTYQMGHADYTINRGHTYIHSVFQAHIRSDSSYVSGEKWSAEVWYDTGALASYTITYNANGGSGAPQNQTRWYGETLWLSTTRPTRTGYTFLGWATSPSGGVAYQPGAAFTGDYGMTLYAVWQINTWTVTYNANGGINAPASQIKTYGQTLKLSTTKPTKVDYNFKGWATSKTNADKGIVAYAAGANYTSNANITLYAVWELAYVRPRITNLTINRCDSAGNNSESGTYLRIDFNWATDMTGVYAIVQWKPQTAEWSSTSAVKSTTILSNSSSKSGTITKKVVGSGGISTESSYTARIYMYDSKGASDQNYRTYSSEFSIGTLSFPIDIRKGGKGIAFGKVAESDNLADYNFDVQFRKNFKLKTPGGIKNFLDAVYPVGSIYMSVKSTNPGTLFGGTWAAIAQGKCLVGVNTSDNDFKTPEKTGGEKTHTLTIGEMPNHSHQIRMRNAGKWTWNDGSYQGDTLEGGYHWSGSPETFNWLIDTKPQGNSQSHNNLQPYFCVYIFKRTG